MRNANEDALLAVAEAITDGQAVDWETALAESPEQRGQLSNLRALETVAEAHRKLQRESSPGRQITQLEVLSPDTEMIPSSTGTALSVSVASRPDPASLSFASPRPPPAGHGASDSRTLWPPS